MGNITSLQHIAGSGSYTRNYNYIAGSNRLSKTTVGATNYPLSYDNRGNINAMPHLSSITFNANNEMSIANLGGGGMAYYQYSGGQRSRKTIANGANLSERIYLGNYEIYRTFVSGSLTLERTTVHISDDIGRIAMLEVRTVGTDPSPANLTRYIYSNHMGTASLELNAPSSGAPQIISYEEYHPYGTTSYQATSATINAVAKRYRYTNKERDDETGLYYHGARYYAPWLARWCAADPLESKYTPESPYNYGHCNPIIWKDDTGMGANNHGHSHHHAHSQPAKQPVAQPAATGTGTYPIAYTNMSMHAEMTHLEGNHIAAPASMQPKPAPHKPSSVERAWNAYKTADPVRAGIISGTVKFAWGTVKGTLNLVLNPDALPEAVKGVAGLVMATDPIGQYTPWGMEVRANVANKVDATINQFKAGDTYTKTEMLTGGTLTVASFAVGAGEFKTASTIAESSELLTVGSGGEYVSGMNIVREIQHGEKVSDIINTAQMRTFSTGVEHAVVRLGPNSISPGTRALVSGGPHGISFGPGEITTLFGHTHPFPTGPSSADFQALQILNQSKQYIFEGLEPTPLIIRKP